MIQNTGLQISNSFYNPFKYNGLSKKIPPGVKPYAGKTLNLNS